MPSVETFSKRAAIASLLAITALQLALHPDATWLLRVMAIAAFATGWFGGRAFASPLHLLWLLAAPLAPAALLLLTGREGPIVDIVWMAGLTGLVLRQISWSRWSFSPLWTLLLGGWALVLSFAWPVMLAREAGFDPRAIADVATINSWAMLSASQVIVWTLYAVQVQLLGLLWFDCVDGAFTRAPDRLPPVVHAMWIGVTLASVVAVIQGTIDISFLNTPFWIREQRAGGTMLDANAYGMAAALAGPVGFLALRGAHRWAPVGAVIVLVVNWSGAWMSGSQTVLLCALFGAAGLTVAVLRSRTDARVIGLAAAAAAVVLIMASATTKSPLQRIANTLAGGARLEELLWSRGGYGTVGNQMVREYPLTGIGAGAFRYLAADYWRDIDDSQLALDNAQNWWRHQAAELGAIGGASILIWSLLVGWRTAAGRTRPGHDLPASVVRALLAGCAAASLLGMPTQNPVVLLWFFLLVAWMDSVVAPVPVGVPSRLIRAGWIAAIAAAIVYAAAHLALGTSSLSVAERAKRFRREYFQGAYAPELIPGGGNFRWTDEESQFVLPARTPWLVMRLWAHHPDIREHPVEVAVDAPCGVVFKRALKSSTPIAIGIELPEGLATIEGRVRVSRTWRPADSGGEDPRHLGVAVLADFVDDRQLVFSQDYSEKWPACP